MDRTRSCPACGAQASYRLGELHCPDCGHVESRLIEREEPRRYSRSSPPGPEVRAPQGDDPLVRGASTKVDSQRIMNLQARRGRPPSLGYRGDGLSAAELGAFITCFFIGCVLFNGLLAGMSGFAEGMISGIIGSAVFTVLVALVLSGQLRQFQGLFMVFAFFVMIAWIYITVKSVQTGGWIGIAISAGGLGISGWLFSILYRQNTNVDA